MKLYGYSAKANLEQPTVPEALAEITLVASPAELRRIAEFLMSSAARMESMGSAYSHEHLSDWDSSFQSSAHLVVAPSSTGDD